jgi:hypothetical protein
LIQLLDRAGWGSKTNRRDSESVVEIAWQIFGENEYKDIGLLNQLVSDKRGTLGWFDLLVFRLQCSADRQGQIHNVLKALIRHQDPRAETTGRLDTITISQMRLLSQQVFLLFKRTYIEPKKNFLDEVDTTNNDAFLGEIRSQMKGSDLRVSESQQIHIEITNQILMSRFLVKSFVVYQLSNSLPPSGSGVGCGYYDEEGKVDNKGIADAMNEYIFNVCFNPTDNKKNALHFFDHCISHLSTPFDTGLEGLVASKNSLAGGLSSAAMGSFWLQHKSCIQKLVQAVPDRVVHTTNYSVKYKEVMESIFSALDDMANEVK